MTKRILQIIPTLDQAGAEKQLTLLAQGLPRERFEVHVCALTRGGPLLDDLRSAEIPTQVIGKRWKIDPLAYRRLAQYVAELKPDLIHSWLFAANAYGRAAGIRCGVKCLVAGERCVDPWKGRRDLAIDRFLAKRTTRIIANSSGVRDFYVEKRLPAEKFEVIPNGINPSPPSPISRDEFREEFGLPKDVHVIGLIGRLWPQKRIKDAIWAADLLKTGRGDTHLLILGDGPQRDRLRMFRDQVAIRDQVHFLGHRDDVPRLVPHFDMLWSTSAYEGQSNAIMEAMSAGVPVIASDIPGNRDLVVPEETGLLVPERGSDGSHLRAGFAKATNRLIEDPALRERMGIAAKKRIAEEFSVPRMIERYAELYERLLEE